MNVYQHNMMQFPDHEEFLWQGGRRRCIVHEENQWWLHINGHRSYGQRNQRGHG